MTPDDGSFHVSFHKLDVVASGIWAPGLGWYAIAAGGYEKAAFDAARHALPAVKHPDFPTVSLAVVPAAATAVGSFTVFGFKADGSPAATVDYGMEGVPLIPPMSGIITLK